MNSKLLGSMAAATLACCCHGETGNFELDSAGVRAGTSKIGDTAQFYAFDAFLNSNLPWHWKYRTGWHIRSRLDLTTGWINGRGDDAFRATIGSTFDFAYTPWALAFEAGMSPTFLTRTDFGHTDFGSIVQFTTHGTIAWRPGSHLSVEARFEHMSNAGLASPNPGLNLYMIGVGWRF